MTTTIESTGEIARLRTLCEAATPGPWAWRGNDDGLVELRGHGPFGRLDGRIISTLPSKPCVVELDDEEVRLTSEACDACKAKWADMLATGTTDVWEDYSCPKPENLGTVWLKGEHFIEPANRWAKRERTYRSDVADVDHPDARLIAAARDALPRLLDEVERLSRALTDQHAAWTAVFGSAEDARTHMEAIHAEGADPDTLRLQLAVVTAKAERLERETRPEITRPQVAETTGTVRHTYATGHEAHRCSCCPGIHVEARHIDGIPNAARCDWLADAYAALPDGAQVRLVLVADGPHLEVGGR